MSHVEGRGNLGRGQDAAATVGDVEAEAHDVVEVAVFGRAAHGGVVDGRRGAAVLRVRVVEADVVAEIISPAGNTNYEFYSVTRQKPVCNKIVWYIMKSNNPHFQILEKEKYSDGGYYEIGEAMRLVTYSQDKALLNLSYKKYKELLEVAI